MFRFMIIFYPLLLTAEHVQAQCDRPVFGENRVMSDDSDNDVFPDKTVVRFKCSTGYVTARASASRSVTCIRRQWTNLDLQCKKKSCGHPGDVNNGRYTFPREDGILFGSTITANCNEGYQLVGRAERNCRETGWDGRPPVCEVLKCLPPPSINSGAFEPEDELYSYGDVVTYSCNGGLDLIGPSEISCSGDGTFQPAPPQCRYVSCESPYIANAVRIEGKSPPYKFNNFVRYKCVRGYKMEGSDYLTCRENGWNPPPPQCNVITCSAPPTIINGQFSPKKFSYTYGESVTYVCVEGFEIDGSKTISCSDNEMFESPPVCQEIICYPPRIRYSFIHETTISTSYKYNTSIIIGCTKGYKLDGSGYLTCGNSGWTPSLPRCIEVTCNAPEINNAVIDGRNKMWYKYGTSIWIMCSEGYKREGAASLTCEQDGWYPPPPQCNVITCSKPPTITNGQFQPKRELYKYGERVTYGCVDGFNLHGSPTISCSDDEKFAPPPPECQEIVCDSPVIPNAVIVEPTSSQTYTYKTSITIRCKIGYRMEGPERLTCMENGWTPNLPHCDKVTCEPLNISNAVIAEINPQSRVMSVRVKCDKGYRIDGSDILTCKANGWNPQPPKCNIVTCKNPPKINNGTSSKDTYTYGENVTYICQEGLKTYGAPISCTDDGTFQPSPSPCLEVTCDAPNIDNAVIIEGQAPYRKQDSIKYKCNKGYNKEGSGNLTCTDKGWNPAPPHCKIVTCRKPSKIFNGNFIPEKEEYEYGQTVIFFCNKGFKLVGDSAVSCSDDGAFHIQNSPQCVEVPSLFPEGTCKTPKMDNSVILEGKEPYEYNMSIKYQCNIGFKTESESDTLTCEENGWNPPSPKCKPVTCDEPQIKPNSLVEEGKSSSYGYKSSVKIKCLRGYTMVGSENLTCEASGWDPAPPACRLKNRS